MVQQKKEIFETPVHILWDNILMIPLFDTLESRRVQDVMEAMLMKVSDTGYKTIIVDILGVAVVDSSVANHIIKITKATKLMGCNSIISGISPHVAQGLVNLGIDMGEVVTCSTLQDALELAFNMSGLEVIKRK